jgi:hypothetical protein
VKLHRILAIRVKLNPTLGLRVKLHAILSLRVKFNPTLGLRIKNFTQS